MSLKLIFISTKKEISISDEKYITEGLISGAITSNDVMSKIKRPTKAVLETLYGLCKNQNEIANVVDYTPKSKIIEIENVNYVISLIRYDLDNFNQINFEKFRTPEKVCDYAQILSAYEAALSYRISRLKNQNVLHLPKEDQDEIDRCKYILYDLRDSFDNASMILSGTLDPKCIDFGTKPQEEDSEPESI